MFIFNNIECLVIFQELCSDRSNTSRGVVLTGAMGLGKTAVLEQIIDNSVFGDKSKSQVRLYFQGLYEMFLNMFRI